MPKSKLVSDDPLVMAVRKALTDIEPRPEPTERRKNEWGFEEVKCPEPGCDEWCRSRAGSYKHHWAIVHGTPFWRENHIIEVVKRGLK